MIIMESQMSFYDLNDINSLVLNIDANIFNKVKEENYKLINENKTLINENDRLMEENNRIKQKLDYYDMIMARNRNRARCRILIKDGLINKSRFKKVSTKIKQALTEKDCLYILKKEIEKEWKDSIEQPLPLDFNSNSSFSYIKTNWTDKIKGWKTDK